jgi:hypothetical protein
VLVLVLVLVLVRGSDSRTNLVLSLVTNSSSSCRLFSYASNSWCTSSFVACFECVTE